MAETTLESLAAQLQDLRQSNTDAHRDIMDRICKVTDDHEVRLRFLEKWQVGFAAKFGAYAAVALFFGSMAAQFLIRWADKIFNK